MIARVEKNKLPGWLWNLTKLVRHSIDDPSLLGKEGAVKRNAKVQWCMILWRFLALSEILFLVAFCPSIFIGTESTLIVFSVSLAYTLLFVWLTMFSKAGSRRYIYTCDQIVCASLLLTSRDAVTVYVLSFYAYACLASFPTPRIREMLPPVTGMSLIFLLAINLTPNVFYSDSLTAVEFFSFYFFGFSFMGFSRILETSSALALDARLEEQRQSYRRSLHDDLGNTLCGLHYKIQSLKRARGSDLKHGLEFLSKGYDRAVGALTQLITGIDETADQSFTESLREISQRSGGEFGISVVVSTPEREPRLSAEIRREALAIVREAVINAAKHSGTDTVRVAVDRLRRHLHISISDTGKGIDQAALHLRQNEGGIGIRGMMKRAEMIDGRLDINAKGNGPGSEITLILREPGSAGLWPRIQGYLSLSPDKIFSLAAALKFLVALLILVQVPLMEPEQRAQPMAWFIAGAVFLDSALAFLFRFRLYEILKKTIWPMVVELLFFTLLIYAGWRSGLPYFFDAAPGLAIVFNACFLSLSGLVTYASFLGLGMIAASFLAPVAASMHLKRTQELVSNIVENIIIALCVGLALEFVRKLAVLKQEAVSRELGRQRELLTAHTHTQLHAQVRELGKEIKTLAAQAHGPQVRSDAIAALEIRSNHIKRRLRQILSSLEAQKEDPGALRTDYF